MIDDNLFNIRPDLGFCQMLIAIVLIEVSKRTTIFNSLQFTE